VDAFVPYFAVFKNVAFRFTTDPETTETIIELVKSERIVNGKYNVKERGPHSFDIRIVNEESLADFTVDILRNGATVKCQDTHDPSFSSKYNIGLSASGKRFEISIVHTDQDFETLGIPGHSQEQINLNAKTAFNIGFFAMAIREKKDQEEWKFVKQNPEQWLIVDKDGFN
jgi:hypothetical protein